MEMKTWNEKKFFGGMLRSYLLNGEETENLVIVETDFIKNCSVEVKTIIAFYSQRGLLPGPCGAVAVCTTSFYGSKPHRY